MNRESADKSPVDRLLDAGVYAPLGFLLTRDETVADLAATGRKQIAFARSLGRAALGRLSASMARTEPGSRSSTPATTPSSEPKRFGDDDLVPGYDHLNAREVIRIASEASIEERRWMLEREQASKARVTVLRALGVADV